jgi:ribonucleoside-diphosphate reductase alpha chain
MMQTSAQVMADAPPQGRRRSATVTATHAPRSKASAAKKTLSIQRTFSDPRTHPFDQVEWERRVAEITDDAGKVVFKQDNVEVPKDWSQLATKVVVSKYFYGEQGMPERETSVRQLIHRICRTIADWGVKDGYFTKAGGEVFYDELTWLCLNQYGAFNSPVWFNVGLYHEYHIGNTSSRGNWFCDPRTGQAERAMQRLLHPVGAGRHGVHHAPGAQRGDALQVRLRHRD